MAEKKNPNYVEEFNAMITEKTWCSGGVTANANIVDREEAHDYIATHGLKVMYQAELNDGTPRRLWLLTDPAGHTCGSLYTAVGHEGTRNKDKFQQDIFDFMEVYIPRNQYKKGEKNNHPRTGGFNIAG